MSAGDVPVYTFDPITVRWLDLCTSLHSSLPTNDSRKQQLSEISDREMLSVTSVDGGIT